MPPKNVAVPPPVFDLTRELVIRGIKILDIGYIYSVYFLLAFYISTWMDTHINGQFNLDTESKKSEARLIAELILQFFMLGILTYVVKNLFELLPFPFEGVYGYQHHRVKELTSGAFFSVIIIWNQHYLTTKLAYLYSRHTNTAFNGGQRPVYVGR